MKIIDLSLPLEHGQLNFPWDPKISIISHNSVQSIGYNMTQISMATHQGTHLDAPFHFFDDGATVDQLSLERCIGPARCIDLAPGSNLAPNTPITTEMLEPHAAAFEPGARILYRTGWNHMFGRPEYFTHFPTLELDAARWIASRKVALLGMDTPTPSKQWLEVHHILLAKGVEIIIVEGLSNMAALPARFTFIGLPLNIKGSDGSPIRAVAVVEEE